MNPPASAPPPAGPLPADRPPAEAAPFLLREDWGRLDYETALARQLACVEARRLGARPDTVAFVEHPHVFTLGVRAAAAAHLHWDASTLAARGVTLHSTRRGGDITYHGPGQLVGYPILDLSRRADLHAYLRALENAVIAWLATLGLAAGLRPGLTGVWLENRKICALGIAVKHWITYHGFALNVDPDLAYFQGIVPCGITDGSVTSLAAELGRPFALDDARDGLWPHLAAALHRLLAPSVAP